MAGSPCLLGENPAAAYVVRSLVAFTGNHAGQTGMKGLRIAVLRGNLRLDLDVE
jgi:hypothetical protein